MSSSDNLKSAGRIAVISLLSVIWGLLVYNVSKMLISSGSEESNPGGLISLTADHNGVLILLAALSGLLFGAVLVLSDLLRSKISELKKAASKALEEDQPEPDSRGILERLMESTAQSKAAEKSQASIIRVNLDHFREINDSFGQVVGDHVQAIFSQTVLKCIRKSDIIGRYVGDEFIIVLPDTDTETAQAISARIKQEVSETHVPSVDGVVISSISCSVEVYQNSVMRDETTMKEPEPESDIKTGSVLEADAPKKSADIQA